MDGEEKRKRNKEVTTLERGKACGGSPDDKIKHLLREGGEMPDVLLNPIRENDAAIPFCPSKHHSVPLSSLKASAPPSDSCAAYAAYTIITMP